MLGRGAYVAARHLLQQVSASARRYDLLAEYFQAEMLLYRNLNIRASVKDYQKRTQHLLEIQGRLAALEEARIRYYAISNLLFNQTLKLSEKEEVRSTIDRLSSLCTDSQHPQVQLYYYLSEVYYQQIDEQYRIALSFCEKYLTLIHGNEALYTRQREAVMNGQRAQAHLRLLELPDARIAAQQALHMFSPRK